MTCAATTPAASPGRPSAGHPRPATSSPSAPCGPVECTEAGPRPDGASDTIMSRAARLTFSNAVQRARYLTVHAALSRRCSEVAV